MKLALRDYQFAAHDAPFKAWGVEPWYNGEGETFRSTLANLATSAGKTIIAAAIALTSIEKLDRKVLFMADSDELCAQPLKKFARCGLWAALEKAGERAPAAASCVVASAQTLAGEKRLEGFRQRWNPGGEPITIIVDEAHRGSPRNKKITDAFPNARILGLTATAFRSGLADLSDFYDHVCFNLGTFDLIGQGYITPIRVQPLPVEIDLTKVRSVKKFGETDFRDDDVSEAITPYYEEITAKGHAFLSTMQTVSFLPLVNSSKRFVEVLRANGISAQHVDGSSPDRKELQAAFEAGEFRVLSNSMLLTTGWDCPPCSCLLNLRATKSVGLFRQMVGRIIRVLDGVIDGLLTPEERIAAIAACAKPVSVILDPLWQVAGMGLVGPASLIAATEEEAEKLTKRERNKDTPWDIAEEFRRMKEDELTQRLREAAKKARKALGTSPTSAAPIDAMHLAAMFHQPTLFDYEPVSRWERQPITPKQRDTLTKEGIDLASVRDTGHASLILEAIQKKKPGRRSTAFSSARSTAPAAPGVERLWSFGKYKGKPLSAASVDYCKWLKEQSWLTKWPAELAHVKKITDPQSCLKLR